KYAEQMLKPRTAYWAGICDLEYRAVRIRDLKSKWGSCSARRNISLNWQLIFLDEDLIDYVIVHELMHLHELNHSPRYWAWVAKFYPEYKAARKRMKEFEWLIGILK
ncbi:MAG: M48 family metallopeptidase, partial [Bacteroidota bacterium]